MPLRAHEEKDHQETALADEAHSEKGQAGEQATRKDKRRKYKGPINRCKIVNATGNFLKM